MEPTLEEYGVLGGLAFALSLFNIVVPIWLGVTVLMSAERRSWGVWLAGGSLFFAGSFFVFHSALLFGALDHLLIDLNIPFFLGWVPIILLPFAWYLGMLWFSGFFENTMGMLRRTHRVGGVLLLVLIVGVIALLIYNYSVSPFVPELTNLPRRYFLYDGNGEHWYLLFALYLVFLGLCYLFSLDALRRLEPTGRVSGDVARSRARPWLTAATVTQLGIASFVGLSIVDLIQSIHQPDLLAEQLLTLRGYHVVILILVTLSLILLGEAIVRYEIFTGVVIPRQGFRKRWRGIQLFGSLIGVGASLGMYLQVPGIYGVLGSIVALSVLYALLTRRSSIERDRHLDDLRSFVGLYEETDHAFEKTESGHQILSTFHLLCRDVLNARVAWLIPLGTTASKVSHTLTYPTDIVIPHIDELPTDLSFDQLSLTLRLRKEEEREVIGVGLWSGKELRGILLLEGKDDDGLYTREELEIARGACEKFLEIMMREEVERKLFQLQRQRLSENRVNEVRVRRLLHDEVLPQLHAAMLGLNTSASKVQSEAMNAIGEVHRSVSDLLRELPVSDIESIERLGFTGALQRLVNDEFKVEFTTLQWEVDESFDQEISSKSSLAVETLYQAGREGLRNVARHARGGDLRRLLHVMISLRCIQPSGLLEFIIEDDGVGVTEETHTKEGVGKGIDLHSTMMEVVGGEMILELGANGGTRCCLRL